MLGGSKLGRAAVVSIIGALALPASVAASPPTVPLDTHVPANGPVSAVAKSGNRVYLGGGFNYVGPNTGTSVEVDATDGSPIGPFARIFGAVNAVVPDGDGGYYAGGSLPNGAGLPLGNVVHVLDDGSVDPDFAPNPNGTV